MRYFDYAVRGPASLLQGYRRSLHYTNELIFSKHIYFTLQYSSKFSKQPHIIQKLTFEI